MRGLLNGVLGVSLVVGSALGMFTEDGAFDMRRGLAIPNSFLAKVNGSEAVCDVVREKIDVIRRELAVDASRGDDGEEEMSVAMPIVSSCIVQFMGDELVKERVEQLEEVQYVTEDTEVFMAEDPPSWGLNRIDQADIPLSEGVPFSCSHTGKGVNVYVIDTGLNKDHVEFKGRAKLGGDFINEGSPVDQNGHGSHCAGTAVGATYGIAKQATIIGVKVLSGSGSGSTAGVINGIRWAVNHQKTEYGGESAVFSMSLGGGFNAAMNDAVNDASEAGHIVVVAAGNENRDACLVSPGSAGGSGKKGGVVTVASSTSSDGRSSFSNYGKCTDIFAPGSQITSAWKGDEKASKTISGTSMATPHVAGVAAVLLEKHKHDKSAAQAELFSLAVANKINNPMGTPNLLLQVPLYTGPPTPPTPAPTSPPTNAPATVCVDKFCPHFSPSIFGPPIPDDKLIAAPIGVSTEVPDLCSRSKQNFKGQFVIVERGGCMFFTKVENAEKQGAVAVAIAMTTSGSPFPPNYYGNDKVGIPSMMVSKKDGDDLRKREGEVAYIGSPSVTAKPTPPTLPPTPHPTNKPTPFPTRAAPTPRPTKEKKTKKPKKVKTPKTKRPTVPPSPRPTKAPKTSRPTKAPTPRPTRN